MLFRDVYQVDGRDLPDRKDRLAALFVNPPRDARAQAERIYEESTRYNIGQVERTINAPTQALEFLRTSNHPRSSFRLGGRTTIAKQGVIELRFQETGQPRIIVTSDDAPASGRAWVVPETGAIVRTQISLATARGTVDISVFYTREERLSLWVPSRMVESYVHPPLTGGSVLSGDSSGVRVEGEATYGDFRRFNVDTRTMIGKSAQ